VKFGTGREYENVKSVLFTCVSEYCHEKARIFRLMSASFPIVEIMFVEMC
jgi:hypothetical protein